MPASRLSFEVLRTSGEAARERTLAGKLPKRDPKRDPARRLPTEPLKTIKYLRKKVRRGEVSSLHHDMLMCETPLRKVLFRRIVLVVWNDQA